MTLSHGEHAQCEHAVRVPESMFFCHYRERISCTNRIYSKSNVNIPFSRQRWFFRDDDEHGDDLPQNYDRNHLQSHHILRRIFHVSRVSFLRLLIFPQRDVYFHTRRSKPKAGKSQPKQSTNKQIL